MKKNAADNWETMVSRGKSHLASDRTVAHDIALKSIAHLREHYPMQYENSKKAHLSLRGTIENAVHTALCDKTEIIDGLISAISILKAASDAFAQLIDKVSEDSKNMEEILRLEREEKSAEVDRIIERERLRLLGKQNTRTPIDRMVDEACGVGVTPPKRITTPRIVRNKRR